jgi:hypothetical protein
MVRQWTCLRMICHKTHCLPSDIHFREPRYAGVRSEGPASPCGPAGLSAFPRHIFGADRRSSKVGVPSPLAPRLSAFVEPVATRRARALGALTGGGDWRPGFRRRVAPGGDSFRNEACPVAWGYGVTGLPLDRLLWRLAFRPTKGNQVQAARVRAISRQTLRARIRRPPAGPVQSQASPAQPLDTSPVGPPQFGTPEPIAIEPCRRSGSEFVAGRSTQVQAGKAPRRFRSFGTARRLFSPAPSARRLLSLDARSRQRRDHERRRKRRSAFRYADTST